VGVRRQHRGDVLVGAHQDQAAGLPVDAPHGEDVGRVVGPADVAALAVHLMANTALTGAAYDVDGGQQLV